MSDLILTRVNLSAITVREVLILRKARGKLFGPSSNSTRISMKRMRSMSSCQTKIQMTIIAEERVHAVISTKKTRNSPVAKVIVISIRAPEEKTQARGIKGTSSENHRGKVAIKTSIASVLKQLRPMICYQARLVVAGMETKW